MLTDAARAQGCTAVKPQALNGYYRDLQGQAGSATLTCNFGFTPNNPFGASRRGPSAIPRHRFRSL